MKERSILWLALCLMLHAGAHAGDGIGGQPGAFLRLGVGSRPLAMGGAFVAVANDVTASYWNPAGLGLLPEPQLGGMYSSLSLDRQYNYAGLAYPLGGLGAISASWINYEIQDIDGRDQTGQATETFSDAETAFLFSYGIQIVPHLALGANVKLLRHSLAKHSASGIGYDAGVLVKPSEFFALGASVQNLQAEISWDTPAQTNETFPRLARMGVNFNPTSFMTLSADYALLEQQNGKWDLGKAEYGEWHAGGEILLGKNLGLRAGNNNGTLTLGASLIASSGNNTFAIDYGFTNESFDRSASHRLGLLMKFGKPRDTQGEVEDELFEQAGAPQESPSEYTLMPAQVREKQGHSLIVNLGRKDELKPGMLLEIYQATRSQRPGKLYGKAKVIKVGSRHTLLTMKKNSNALPSAGDKLMVKILAP